MYAYMQMNTQIAPKVRGGDFSEHEDVKKVQKHVSLVEQEPPLGVFVGPNGFQIHPGTIPEHPSLNA